jgi:hypothetical protein
LDPFGGRVDETQAVFLPGLKLELAHPSVGNATRRSGAAGIVILAIDLIYLIRS